jgi:hypothetical protein
LGSASAFFRLFFGSFSRARIIRTKYNREVLYFSFIAIPLLYCYIYYIPFLPPFLLLYYFLSLPVILFIFPPFFISPPSGLWYIVIYYITPGGAFFSFPVYIDIILYIPRLDTVLYFSPGLSCIIILFSPRLLVFSLLPGVFAVDAAGGGWQRTAGDGGGVSAGPSWRCPLWPFGVLGGDALAGADC